MYSSLIGKVQKAHQYAQEPDRVNFLQFHASFRGEHDRYKVTYDEGEWRCSCHHFGEHNYCSHMMAIERMLAGMISHQTPVQGRD